MAKSLPRTVTNKDLLELSDLEMEERAAMRKLQRAFSLTTRALNAAGQALLELLDVNRRRQQVYMRVLYLERTEA